MTGINLLQENNWKRDVMKVKILVIALGVSIISIAAYTEHTQHILNLIALTNQKRLNIIRRVDKKNRFDVLHENLDKIAFLEEEVGIAKRRIRQGEIWRNICNPVDGSTSIIDAREHDKLNREITQLQRKIAHKVKPLQQANMLYSKEILAGIKSYAQELQVLGRELTLLRAELRKLNPCIKFNSQEEAELALLFI